MTLLCHLLWHYCGSIVSFIVTGVGKDTRLQHNCYLGFSFNDTLANYCWECFRWVSRRNNCNCVSQKTSKYRRSSLINSLDCSNTWNGPVVEGLEEFVAAETLVVTEGAPVSSLQSYDKKKAICRGFRPGILFSRCSRSLLSPTIKVQIIINIGYRN